MNGQRDLLFTESIDVKDTHLFDYGTFPRLASSCDEITTHKNTRKKCHEIVWSIFSSSAGSTGYLEAGVDAWPDRLVCPSESAG